MDLIQKTLVGKVMANQETESINDPITQAEDNLENEVKKQK